MTATALGAQLTATHNTISDDLQPSNQRVRRSWACNTCHLSFNNGEAQREHMKSSWQHVLPRLCLPSPLTASSVYNLKRRITSLPPISLVVFEDKLQTEPLTLPRIRKSNYAKDTYQQAVMKQQCLFCHLAFEDDTEELSGIIEHMFTMHGLYIPEQTRLSDSASFLGYLTTQVRSWHECLYCGSTKTSTEAVQCHMKDSGHCMLNFEREPELLEFWERPSDAQGEKKNDVARPSLNRVQELQQPRRKEKRSKTVHRQLQAKKTRSPGLNEPGTSQASEQSRLEMYRNLSRRDTMGLVGVSSHERHALTLAVKRSQKEEAMATRAKEWTYGRKANSQKNDQAHGPLSWAKGGMHNLLPR